jgi:hypothetical protein
MINLILLEGKGGVVGLSAKAKRAKACEIKEKTKVRMPKSKVRRRWRSVKAQHQKYNEVNEQIPERY